MASGKALLGASLRILILDGKYVIFPNVVRVFLKSYFTIRKYCINLIRTIDVNILEWY